MTCPAYFALLSYNTYGKTSERELAIAECAALGRGTASKGELDDRIMGLDSPVSIGHSAFLSLLVETIAAAPTLAELCAGIEARQAAADNFKIIVRKIPKSLPHSTLEFQAAVARALRGKPNLDRPKDVLLLVITTRNLWLGRIVGKSEDRWRLHRVRPVPYIRGLPTRVARAILNLVARPGDRVVDPCCGAGTFLTEAADMGIRAEGFDIAPKMVAASNTNLRHFGFAPAARIADARTLIGRWDAVVTDPPYGHISNYEDGAHTGDILRNLLNLAPRIAVVTANGNEPALAGASPQTIPLPVSRSLTRHIHVVR